MRIFNFFEKLTLIALLIFFALDYSTEMTFLRKNLVFKGFFSGGKRPDEKSTWNFLEFLHGVLV